MDPTPQLHVFSGKIKTGKTTFALSLARSWALRLSPWSGAPCLPGTRVLIVSAEQPAFRIDSTLRRLSVYSPSGEENWTDRITIVGRDGELSPEGRRLLTLDTYGLGSLRGGLERAAKEGDPYGLVILDSLSRLKPSGVEEIDNDAMTAWLSQLTEIADLGAYPLVIHHVGHSTDPSRSEARNAGRGASAIGAVAQGTWLLERVPGEPRQLRLKVEGNLLLPREITFEVAPDTAEPHEIRYFRPIDPLADYDPSLLLSATDWASTRDLAWRLSGQEPAQGKAPPGQSQQLAGRLRERWRREGRIEVTDGPRKSKLIRLKSTDPTTPQQLGDRSEVSGE